MQKVRFLVVPGHVRAYHAFQLRIKVREEVGMTEQHPVKENDVVELHAAEHDKVTPEKAEKAESISDPVPYADKEQNGDPLDHPAGHMRTVKSLFSCRGSRPDSLAARRRKNACPE